MEQSISLEETNRIRISLGLKPLTDDSAPADDKDKQAETNYTKQRDAEAKQRETKYVFVFAYIDVELIIFSPFKATPGSHCQVSVIPQLLPAVTSTTSLGFQGAWYLVTGLLMQYWQGEKQAGAQCVSPRSNFG
jgi:HIND motif